MIDWYQIYPHGSSKIETNEGVVSFRIKADNGSSQAVYYKLSNTYSAEVLSTVLSAKAKNARVNVGFDQSKPLNSKIPVRYRVESITEIE